MTNEMKLLLALIDALGFEVDETGEFRENEYNKAMEGYRHIKKICEDGNQMPPMPPFKLDYSTIDYKLTKKENYEIVVPKESLFSYGNFDNKVGDLVNARLSDYTLVEDMGDMVKLSR